MFINNKYTKWYDNIIQKAKNRKLDKDQYTEKHHIIPKSIGGNNGKENIAILTAREHFLCHWLLTRMLHGKEKQKMWHAFWRMNTKQRYYSSIGYAAARKQHSEWMKINSPLIGRDVSGKNNPNYGKGMPGKLNPFYGKHHTKETKQKLRQANLGHSYNKGIPKSDEHRKKISEARKDKTIYKWYHDQYGCEECTRTELIAKYPVLNIKSSELWNVVKGKYKHRGWKIID